MFTTIRGFKIVFSYNCFKIVALPFTVIINFCHILELNSVDLGGEATTADDFLIAQLLQKQFDKEFDENLQNVSF